MTRARKDRTAVEQIEWMRNLLAFMLVGGFILFSGVLLWKAIPNENEQLLSYMLGQLSGMALTVLAFYFIDKVGQAALDAARAENTGKMADLANTALKSGPVTDDSEAIRPGDTVTLDKPADPEPQP